MTESERRAPLYNARFANLPGQETGGSGIWNAPLALR